MLCCSGVSPDRKYAFVDAPKDILNEGWTYISSAMDSGNPPCLPKTFNMPEYQGGFKGKIPEGALVGICCANHHDQFELADGEFPVVNAVADAAKKAVSGVAGIKWYKHAGTFEISNHGGEPCTFYEAAIPAGECK